MKFSSIRLISIVILASATAGIITYAVVIHGLDWYYLLHVAPFFPRHMLFLADILGFIIPVLLPAMLFGYGLYTRSEWLRTFALRSALTVFVALAFSSLLKVFTGRASPLHHGTPTVDTSADFNFGFMQESILGGWPSSHATVAFALATLLTLTFPRSRLVGPLSFALAFFIALGESIGFHWFSECIAGALIGSAIGFVCYSVRNVKRT